MNHIQTSESRVHRSSRSSAILAASWATRIGDGVLYGEWYIKADKDGDGVPELRYICTMGETHEIVHDEHANRVKFACFGVDPISHTIIGD